MRRAALLLRPSRPQPDLDDLADVLASGPAPYATCRGEWDAAPADVRLVAASSPSDAEIDAALATAAAHRLAILEVRRGEAAARAAQLAARHPEVGYLVGATPDESFLGLVAQGFGGAAAAGGEVTPGGLVAFLEDAAGVELCWGGPLPPALTLRRVTPPPAVLANPSALEGRVLAGRYAIGERLGGGGMGLVYRARQLGIDREVAVKVLGAALAGDERAGARFRREARLVSRLQHPNVVALYDFGTTDDGLAYMAMELVAGRSLARLLRDEGPLPVARAIDVLDQVAAALQAAHAQGIVHRDLKPDNVVVDLLPDGRERVRVLDFGLARADAAQSKLTATGAVMGTPAYMAPEQAKGQAGDERTDVYQVGVMAWQMLAGQLPFVAEGAVALMVQHVGQAPPPLAERRPGLPAALVALVEQMLAKAPDDRPASFTEVRARLAAVPAAAGEALLETLAPDAPSSPPVVSGTGPAAVPASAPPSATGSSPPPVSAAGPAAVPASAPPSATGSSPPPAPPLTDEYAATPAGPRRRMVAAAITAVGLVALGVTLVGRWAPAPDGPAIPTPRAAEGPTPAAAPADAPPRERPATAAPADAPPRERPATADAPPRERPATADAPPPASADATPRERPATAAATPRERPAAAATPRERPAAAAPPSAAPPSAESVEDALRDELEGMKR